MSVALALLAGWLVAVGVYLILRRNLLRIVFGTVLLSNAVNLLVFGTGRALRGAAPIAPEGGSVPPLPHADPVPQALVLTAIVIGFGLTSFLLALVARHHAQTRALTPEAEPPAPEAPTAP